jgi:hypothetical protein
MNGAASTNPPINVTSDTTNIRGLSQPPSPTTALVSGKNGVIHEAAHQPDDRSDTNIVHSSRYRHEDGHQLHGIPEETNFAEQCRLQRQHQQGDEHQTEPSACHHL